MEAKKVKGQVPIMVKLLCMVIIPCILMGIIIDVAAAKNMTTGIREESIERLRSTAYTLKELYDNVAEGEYRQDESGAVFKGDYQISDNFDIVDQIKEKTDTDVTFFYGDTRIVTSLKDKDSGDRLVGTQASDTVIQTVLQGNDIYYDLKVKINDLPYYGYYVPIDDESGNVVAMAFAGVESSSQNAFIRQRVMQITILEIIIMIITVILAIISSNNISKSVRGAESVLKQMEQGNLAVEIDDAMQKRNDEIGSMVRSLESLRARLFRIIGDIRKSSEVLNDSSNSLSEMAEQSSTTADEMNKVIEDISKGAISQAEEIEEASKNIGEMGEVIEEIVSNVDTLGTASTRMKNASDESGVIIEELSKSNDRTTHSIVQISKQIQSTNESVRMIEEAVELITSIAGQTNLLALNASIEAARAGEHGKGFAVVASEIQQLAEQSNNSADRIKKVIQELASESEESVRVMEEVERIIAEQQEKLNETRTKFNDVTQGINESREEAEVIQNHTEICDASRVKVIDVIANLSAISQQNAAGTEESTASMGELSETIRHLAESAGNLKELSDTLNDEVEFFQL